MGGLGGLWAAAGVMLCVTGRNASGWEACGRQGIVCGLHSDDLTPVVGKHESLHVFQQVACWASVTLYRGAALLSGCRFVTLHYRGLPIALVPLRALCTAVSYSLRCTATASDGSAGSCSVLYSEVHCNCLRWSSWLLACFLLSIKRLYLELPQCCDTCFCHLSPAGQTSR